MRRFRSNGAEEYNVVANRMAVTFNRKSTTNAAGLYGAKNDRRD